QRFGGELAGAVLVVDGDHAFRGRGEPLGQAELLEGFARPVRGRHEADEEDERRRVLPGGVDGDHRNRRTRTARDHGDARTPGQAGGMEVVACAAPGRRVTWAMPGGPVSRASAGAMNPASPS